MARRNPRPERPTELYQSSASPTGVSRMEAATKRHQANTSESPARFSSRFHEEWATAENSARIKDTAVLGLSIAASGPSTPRPKVSYGVICGR